MAEACPRGGGAYDACCGRYARGAAAPTPEALMRSRCSAFARGEAACLLATWYPATRPPRVDLDPELRWTSLEVLGADGGLLDLVGAVRFRASYVRRGVAGVQAEHSRFARDAGRWAYVGPVRPSS